MALTPKQTQRLDEVIARVVGSSASLSRLLERLSTAADHETVGADVRAHLEQFATLQEWNQYRNTVQQFVDAVGASFEAYQGGDLPTMVAQEPPGEE